MTEPIGGGSEHETPEPQVESDSLRERYRLLSAELAAIAAGQTTASVGELNEKEAELASIDATLRQIGGDWAPLQADPSEVQPRPASESLGEIQEQLRQSQKTRLERALFEQSVLRDQVFPAVTKDLAETDAWRQQLEAADREVESAITAFAVLGGDPESVVDEYGRKLERSQAERKDEE